MGQIGHKFTEAVRKDVRDIDGTRASAVIISRDLYDSYLGQYMHAQRLSLAMEGVMEDGEHRLVLEEARHIGYKLPDEAAFRRELATYREFLNSFNPYDVSATHDGRVRVPLRTARAFHFMAEYNRALAEHVLVAVMHTEYLRRFTDLKRDGFAYAGPTALQQTVDVLAAQMRTEKEERRQRLNRDWPRFAP